AVMTNTMAYTAYFGAIVAYLAAIRRNGGKSTRWMLLAILAGMIALYLYDPTIVMFGMVLFAMILHRLTHRSWPLEPRTRMLGTIAARIVLLSYALVRSLVVPAGTPGFETADVGTMIRNAGIYSLGLVNPMDMVLAHSWLGSPLPPEIFQQLLLVFLGAVLCGGLAVFVGALIIRWTRRSPQHAEALDPETIFFLLGGIFLPLVPVLVLSG